MVELPVGADQARRKGKIRVHDGRWIPGRTAMHTPHSQ